MSGEFLGRERELDQVRALLDGVKSQGTPVLLRGGPGTGKTSVLDWAMSAAAARHMQVITVKGTRLEAGLPFAGVHQLVQPFLSRIRQLPVPQRDAVEAAFGIAATARPDPFLIALGLLNLLRAAALTVPLLVAVDDAQWLDYASSEVLAITARRLRPAPVILAVAIRPHPESPLTSAGLPVLDLEPLDADSAGALLSASFPRLSDAEREQVLATAGGNPLALLELPRVLHAERPSYPSTLPLLTPRLERAFAARDLGLTEAARRLLLIAAASDTGDTEEVLRAAATQVSEPVTTQWLAPAVRARLIYVEATSIRFSSSAARSAVYAEASPPERRAAHFALAGLLEGQPERYAWHQAATVDGPDETVAQALELAAGQALQRGAVTGAVAAAGRAATLTPEPQLRGTRLLRTAELALDLGRNDMVRQLTPEARSLPLRDGDQVRALWLERIADSGLSLDPGSSQMLTELADQARRAGAADLALTILGGAAFCYFWSGRDSPLGPRLVADLRDLPVPADPSFRLAALALADPAGQGGAVTQALSRLQPRIQGEASAAYAAGAAAALVGDVDLGASLLAAAVAQLQSQGRVRLLARALTVQAWAAVHLADWATASSAARDGVRLAGETGQPLYVAIGRGALLTMAALRGNQDAALPVPPAGSRLAASVGRYELSMAYAARGVSALGDGRYGVAYEYLRRIFDPQDHAFHHAQRYWHVHDLAEAAVRSGHLEEARATLSVLYPDPGTDLPPWLRAGAGYARALTAEDRHAEKLFRAALDAAGGVPFILARAQLAYGSWLRRQRRSAESRDPLRAAVTSFDALGYRPWLTRASQELRASGEPASASATRAGPGLSPQERTIAELAASGLTNQQIGRQLYLSPRTIATHLYRLFPKLGISSRSQLQEALRDAQYGLDWAGGS